MKRCLLLAGIACLWACSASAIAVNWKIPTGWDAATATATLVSVGDSSEVSSDALVQFAKSFANPGETPSSSFTGYAWVGDVSMTNGRFTGSLGDVELASGNYYLVLLEKDGAKWAHNKNGVSFNADNVGSNSPFVDLSIGGSAPIPVVPYDPGEYVEGMLPEPTVLALLALGVSGLALRRKVA